MSTLPISGGIFTLILRAPRRAAILLWTRTPYSSLNGRAMNGTGNQLPAIIRLRRPLSFGWAIALAALLVLAACRPHSDEPQPASANLIFWPEPADSPASYRLDCQPFSPTLAHLADQGRLLVLPAAQVAAPPSWSPIRGYAMSAIDRYGRLYHFDTHGSWWMDDLHALPEPLPPAGWDAAWNERQSRIELLVTSPWRGGSHYQLIVRQGNRWRPLDVSAAPPAQAGVKRVFLPSPGAWLTAGGSSGSPAQPKSLENRLWRSWPAPQPEDGPAPDLTRIRALPGETSRAGVLVLLDDGHLWQLQDGRWLDHKQVPAQGLLLARTISNPDRLLLVWSGGLGRDRIGLIDLDPDTELDEQIHEFSQIAQVRINEEESGDWIGWQGEGSELALRLATEAGEQPFRAADVKLIELPPRLSALRPEGAVWVPALGGLVVPAADGIGLDHRRLPFSPALTGDGEAPADAPLVDVIQRSFRFWVFRDDLVEFLKPPNEIHPDIGHLLTYQTPDHTRRSLSWIWPEPGVLRYEYRAASRQNEQWLTSWPLTLNEIPLLDRSPDSRLHLCNVVVWGDPAQVVVVGWSGPLDKPIPFPRSSDAPAEEGYASVPTQGFMARINALAPEHWEVTPLPIPFCQGTRLIVDSVRNHLYLVGGKQAVPREVDGREYQFMLSNDVVWQWDGSQWRSIEPGEIDLRMKITTDLVFHNEAGLLLSLTPGHLYGFDSRNWHELWRDTGKNDWPEQVGLYVHPLTGQTVGIWFNETPRAGVWSGRDWIPVEVPVEAHEAGAFPAWRRNLLPAMHRTSFISIDAADIAAIRMNANRDRQQDRNLAAWELTLVPAGE